MKIASVCPGYTSQFIGMGKELYDEHRVVEEYFEEASACLPINFVKLIFAASEIRIAGDGQRVSVAIFLVTSAIIVVLKEQGIKPTLVAGYNNGNMRHYVPLIALRYPMDFIYWQNMLLCIKR